MVIKYDDNGKNYEEGKSKLPKHKNFAETDKDIIMQVIINLPNNSIKYCEKNGTIKIVDYTKEV